MPTRSTGSGIEVSIPPADLWTTLSCGERHVEAGVDKRASAQGSSATRRPSPCTALRAAPGPPLIIACPRHSPLCRTHGARPVRLLTRRLLTFRSSGRSAIRTKEVIFFTPGTLSSGSLVSCRRSDFAVRCSISLSGRLRCRGNNLMLPSSSLRTDLPSTRGRRRRSATSILNRLPTPREQLAQLARPRPSGSGWTSGRQCSAHSAIIRASRRSVLAWWPMPSRN